MYDNEKSECGFTLVELLVVLAILGILAAIGMTQYGGYKQKAADALMVADLHSARNAMEGYYEANSYSYSGATPAVLQSDHGFRSSHGVALVVVTATDFTFLLRACTGGGTTPAFDFDTAVGSALPSAGACP